MVFCGQLLGAAGPNRRRCKKVSITQPAVPLTKTAHRSQDTSLLHRREVEESGFAPVAPNRPLSVELSCIITHSENSGCIVAFLMLVCCHTRYSLFPATCITSACCCWPKGLLQVFFRKAPPMVLSYGHSPM